MNDDEMTTMLREQRDKVPMTIPVEQIVSRGRAVRARRLVPAGGALAVATGAALAVTVLAPAGHQAGQQQAENHAARKPAVQLAAWTVTKLAGGDIFVTIRELKDPGGLQRTLRADGVPASVTFLQHQNAACRAYPGGTPRSPQTTIATPLLRQVFPRPYQDSRFVPKPPGAAPGRNTFTRITHARLRPTLSEDTALIEIDPSALPGNAGVQITSSYRGLHGGFGIQFPGLVYASPRCTGS